ncbi:MAG: hypothetical protein BWY62_01348 [Firmicutes bacterium ADurb.Bin356]|nr:MAG: hypothetical protein BWY62_01348 [Firmicutes bacterium ADurb.Bin356]
MSFIQTLLPEPVAPAIKRCGIFDKSATIILPAISLPSASVTGDFAFINSLLSTMSRSTTVAVSLLGISIPTADLPGIGASIRTRGAASASAISSASAVMRFTRTPGAGASSYLVITGPTLIFTIRAETLKFWSVSTKSLPFSAGDSRFSCP